MATTGAGVFAAGAWPSIRRRDTSTKLKPIPITKRKLSLSASAVPTELTAESLSANGVVEKKTATEKPSSSITGGDEPKDGRLTLKDYFDQCRQLISISDGGPPRWFSPLECASQAKGSPLLLYLPGVDGVGLGLTLHHERLSKIFDIRCMHIPLTDRTSFTELVKFVESAVRTEHSRAPNKPIYLVGESFGGCLALAVAARNPDINLMLILANPATSFGKSLVQTETLLTLSALIPEQISSTLPYVLTLLLGTPAKMVTSAIGRRLPSDQLINELSQDTIAMSSYLSVMSKAFTGDTLRWKLNMLKSAAAFANSRLHAIKAQTLILASGLDQLLPSRDEAGRLHKLLPNCQIRVFEGKGHGLFLVGGAPFFASPLELSHKLRAPEQLPECLILLSKEDGVSFVSILNGACFYRHGQRHDYATDYLRPTPSEFARAYAPQKWIDEVTSPVLLSTLGDGTIVRSLDGIPTEGPVLYVGYHMMLGLELYPLVSNFWTEKNILLRGMAHPMMFSKSKEGNLPAFSAFDIFRVMGAVPVTAPNFYRLFSSKAHVLLYPGGVREALHRKGEEYKLFWPEQSEFVRMAAKFGTKIVPFGTVGEDDIGHLLLDLNDLNKVPYFKNGIEGLNNETVNVRNNAVGEVMNQDLHLPIVVPKVPGRFYYLFGKPIETEGRKQELRSKEKAHELYLEVKSEVEKCLSYLKEKRENDPFRNIFARLYYQATHGIDSEVPTFDLTTNDS